jgi:hypothetical protein
MLSPADALLLLMMLPWLLAPDPVFARPAFGNAVDTFCTDNTRTPATRYAGDCAICHNVNDARRNRTPGFSEYRSHRDDRDFSDFCPAALPHLPPFLEAIGNQILAAGDRLVLPLRATDTDDN